MGLQRYPFQKYPGIDLSKPDVDLDPSYSPNLQNVRPVQVMEDESIKQREGAKRVKQASGTPDPGVNVKNPLLVADTVNPSNFHLWVSGSDGTNSKIFRALSNGAGGWGDYVLTHTSSTTDQNEYYLKYAFGFVWAIPRDSSTETPRKITTAGVVSAWTNPPSASGVMDFVVWRGRGVVALGAANTNRLKYSDIGNLELPASNWGNNFIDIFDEANTENIRLLVFNDNLYLFKRNSMWLIYDPTTFANRKLSNRGLGNNADPYRAFCGCPYDGRIYWFSYQDRHIHSSDGNAVGDVIETRAIAPALQVNDIMAIVPEPHHQSVLAYEAFTGNCWEICLNGKPGQHPIYKHNFGTVGQNFMPLITGPNSGQEHVYTLDRNTGGLSRRAFRLFTDLFQFSDDYNPSVAIDSYFETSWMPLQAEEPMERMRRLNLMYSGAPRIEVFAEMFAPQLVDPMGAGMVPKYMALMPNYTELSGSGSYGNRQFGYVRPESRGRYHKVRLSSRDLAGVPRIDTPWTVSNMEFVFRGGKEHR